MTDEMIAERRFWTVGGDTILARWMKPVPEGDDWICVHQLSWGSGREWRRKAYGVDSAEALVSAFQIVGADLYSQPDEVYRFDPGDVLGLPVLAGLEGLILARSSSGRDDGR